MSVDCAKLYIERYVGMLASLITYRIYYTYININSMILRRNPTR